ncbi:MAG: hypothetical protein RLZZ623_1800, partial [Actinomycetota bacterium]
MHRRRQTSTYITLTTLLVLAGCASSSPAAAPTTPVTTAASTPPTTPPTSAASTPPIATTGSNDTATTVTSTEAATAPAPLGDANDCPLGALDAATGVTNISLWFDWQNIPGETFKALVSRFNAEHPKVQVDAQFQDSGVIRTKYLTSLSGGTKPDLLSLQSTGLQSVIDSKSTVPFGACLAADGANVDDMLPVVKAITMNNDTLTALPFGPAGQLLYYRKSVFIKAGLDPNKPPKTLDEVRAASKAIMSSGAAKHGISMYATAQLLTMTLAAAGQPWADQPDDAGRATHLAIATDLGVTTLTTLRDMVTTGELLAFPSGPSPDALLALGSGDVGMAMVSANGLGDVVKFIAGSGGDIAEAGVGPQPSFGPDQASSYQGAGKAMFIVQNGDPAKVEAAYQFLKWLEQPAQIAEFSSATGTIATTTGAAA